MASRGLCKAWTMTGIIDTFTYNIYIYIPYLPNLESPSPSSGLPDLQVPNHLHQVIFGPDLWAARTPASTL